MKSVKHILTALTCGGALLAGSMAIAAKPGTPTAEAEVLHAMYFENGFMYLTVTSHGCTTAESFAIRVTKSRSDAGMTVERLVPDECGGPAFPVTVAFDIQVIQYDGYKAGLVKNKFAAF